MDTADNLLTRQQAAEFLTVRPQTLAVWAMARKHVPFVKVGKAVRYRLSDLEAFVEQQTIEPPVAANRQENIGLEANMDTAVAGFLPAADAAQQSTRGLAGQQIENRIGQGQDFRNFEKETTS